MLMCKKDDVGDIIRIFELDNYTLVKGLSFSTFSVSLKNWILNGDKLMQVKTESFGNVVMCTKDDYKSTIHLFEVEFIGYKSVKILSFSTFSSPIFLKIE